MNPPVIDAPAATAPAAGPQVATAPPATAQAATAPPAGPPGVSRYLARPTPSFWRALRLLAGARLLLALVLVGYVPVMNRVLPQMQETVLDGFATLTRVYLGFSIITWILTQRARSGFHWRLLTQVALDLVLIGLLVRAGGGAVGWLGVLMLTPVGTAAVLTTPVLALFIGSVGALILLGIALAGLLAGHAAREGAETVLLQPAIIGALLLFTSLVLNLLARRLAQQESVAEHAQHALRQQLAINQLVIDQIDQGVLVFGDDAMLRAINPMARALLHRVAAPAEIVDRLLAQIDAGRPHDAWTALCEDGQPLQLRSKLLGAAAGPDPHAGTSAAAALTERVVLLEDMARVEQQALQMKLASMGRLSASIAHEIRNPLASIRHAGSLIAERADEPVGRRLAAIIETNSVRIDRIVEDVLSVARRSAHRELVALAGFVTRFLAEQSWWHAGDARIAVRIGPAVAVAFDPEHLRQILVNLLDNARRHASDAPGAITIEAAGRARSGIVQLAVRDDGPGVPPAARGSLFEPFFTTGPRGTGLGLYVARELCALNDARLRYDAPAAGRPHGAFVIDAASVAVAQGTAAQGAALPGAPAATAPATAAAVDAPASGTAVASGTAPAMPSRTADGLPA